MIAFILNFLVLSLTWLSFSPAWQAWRSWADLALGLSFCFQTLSLGMETLKVGHLPLHNLYGSVLFLSCLCAWFLTFYGFWKGPYKTMTTCFRGQGGPAQTTSEQRVSRRFGSWRETLVFARFSSLLLPKSSPSWKVQTSGINASFTGNLRQSVFPTCQGWTLETKQACQTQTYRATACIVSPLMVLCHLFCFYLPTDLKKPQPLIPALQSHWLEMHVVSMLASYCLLFCGGLFAFAFLFYTWQPGQKRLEQNAPKFTRSTGEALNLLSSDLHALHRPDGPLPGAPADGPLPGAPADGPLPGAEAGGLRPAPSLDGLHAAQKPQTHFESLNWLDLASYRTIGLGFAFLTCGLISGAVWANETWSTFWSWDVKETWALITWLIFAMYLHTRLFQGWHGKKSAWFAGLGFVSVWITYLGVNLLSKGLHSYGFLFPS